MIRILPIHPGHVKLFFLFYRHYTPAGLCRPRSLRPNIVRIDSVGRQRRHMSTYLPRMDYPLCGINEAKRIAAIS
jgi:hypothetical protein